MGMVNLWSLLTVSFMKVLVWKPLKRYELKIQIVKNLIGLYLILSKGSF